MTFFSIGVGLLIYVVLWMVMPSDESTDEPGRVSGGSGP